MIYGHRHRITDCDQFTDDFLKAQGIHVNPKEPEPEDPFGEYRKKVSTYIQYILRNMILCFVLFIVIWPNVLNLIKCRTLCYLKDLLYFCYLQQIFLGNDMLIICNELSWQ